MNTLLNSIFTANRFFMQPNGNEIFSAAAFLVMILITPANASAPYTTDIGPSTISIRSIELMSIWLISISLEVPCRPTIGKPSINIFTFCPFNPIIVISDPPVARSCEKRMFNSLLSASCNLVAPWSLNSFFGNRANLVNRIFYRLRFILACCDHHA